MKTTKTLTPEEMQVAVMILLEKANLSVQQKNDLRFATSLLRSEELDLRRRLARVLTETATEREIKKDTP